MIDDSYRIYFVAEDGSVLCTGCKRYPPPGQARVNATKVRDYGSGVQCVHCTDSCIEPEPRRRAAR